MINSANLDNELGLGLGLGGTPAAPSTAGGEDDDEDVVNIDSNGSALRAPLLGGFGKGGDMDSVHEAGVQQVCF